MLNQQEPEDDRNVDQLKLNLIYSARDQLLTNLIQLSAILQCNKSLPPDETQRTREKIKESVLLLMELSFEVTLSADDSSWFDQLTFELPRAKRSRIVTHLIDIKDAALSDGLITGETKRSLLTENRRLIDELLDLPCKVQGNMIGGAGSVEEKHIGDLLKRMGR